ncbi:MAG TPA: ribosome maturation factor RimM [Myxococcales bacterium]|nr:ribosome maturation factor RimM [Myxococcales bacterium]
MERLAVGKVARAHGVRGRVLIAPYHAGSESLGKVRRLWLGGGEYEVARAEQANLGWLVTLKGVDDRDQADALRGQEVKVDRAELPPPGENEIYAIDLVGCEVVDGQGVKRGVVEDIEEAGPQDLLRLTDGALVPMGLVKEVSQDGRRIVIDAPEGLFELEEPASPATGGARKRGALEEEPAAGGARRAQHPTEE